ncbi:2-hydroxyacid dehydrogenase [Thalassotalea agariperforans]
MFKVAVFSSKQYDKDFLLANNHYQELELTFFDSKLTQETVELANGFDAISIFVNDEVDQPVLTQLNHFGINIIALRCAGFNNIDIEQAQKLNFQLCRVPEYSPEAVAEHAVGLMLTLSRKFHKAYNRVRDDNFSLDGLMGFNLHEKTVGVIGTGNIGLATLKILKGFGCQLLCHDPVENPLALALGVNYVDLNTLYQNADIISLHCPLNAHTAHVINAESLSLMKNNVMLINTSRGGLIDSKAVLQALKQKKIGYLGLDVYELESKLFFEDMSAEIIDDDVFQRFLTFPNVLITGHQGFFTKEALNTIAKVTLENLDNLLNKKACQNLI